MSSRGALCGIVHFGAKAKIIKPKGFWKMGVEAQTYLSREMVQQNNRRWAVVVI